LYRPFFAGDPPWIWQNLLTDGPNFNRHFEFQNMNCGT
jgi:hypothetical protein